MKGKLVVLIALISFTIHAQEKLNAYKYVVIPSKFDFQKTENQYGINMLLKYKFQQLGFETYLDNETLPKAVVSQNCSVLTPVILSKENMFMTKVIVVMKDCYKNTIFTTEEGISRSKNYKTAYNEAFRDALKSFSGYHLKYSPKEDTNLVINNEAIEQEQLESVQNDKTINKKPLVGTKIKYSYKNDTYLFIKKDALLTEIHNMTTGKIVGQMLASALKKGIYHISFNAINGFCYYGENSNLIVEYLSNDNTVHMISLPRVD